MSAASDSADALRSLGLACTGDVFMAVVPRARDDDVLTVVQGRLGREVHPSDSEVDNSDPDPDLPSKAVSAAC